MSKLLSIIVNSYNEEKYIEDCLDSILKQLSKDVELLVIDDGSIDNSASIINNKLNKVNNSSFFKINHLGISNARNFGIEKSNGNYIMFVDGDDYILDNSLNKIIDYVSKNTFDISLFNTIKLYEKEKYYVKEKNIINSSENVNISDLICNKVCARPWRFIHKKDFILKNNILFPNNLVYEDEEWVSKIIYYSNIIKFFDEYIYVYRKHDDSITTTKSIDNIKNLMTIVERVYNWSLECTSKKEYIYFSLSRCIRNVLSAIDDFEDLNDKRCILNWYKTNYKMVDDILNYNEKLKYSISTFGPLYGVKIYKKLFREEYLIKKEKVLKL